VDATDYYVNKSIGSDSNNGTANTGGSAWLTIGKAISEAVADDTVYVMAGTYYETLVMSASGSSGQPITFIGERDGIDYLTIIDGSDDKGSGWVYTTDSGWGYEKSYEKDCGYDPMSMMIDHPTESGVRVTVAKWSTNQMDGVATLSQQNVPGVMTRGVDYEDCDETEVVWPAGDPLYDDTCAPILFWDGPSSWFGYDTSEDKVYMRILDGGDTDPNNRNVRTDDGRGEGDAGGINGLDPGQAIEIESQSYITISDFEIRGSRIGVFMWRVDSHHNIVEDCLFYGGIGRVQISLDAHDNIIRNNTMYNGMESYDEYQPHPFEKYASLTTDDLTEWYQIGVGQNYYTRMKYWAGDSEEQKGDFGIFITGAGAGNEASGNTIYNGSVGIAVNDVNDVLIHDNTIHHMVNQCVWLLEDATNIHVYDNNLYDSNILIRLQDLDKGDCSIWVWGNTLWQPRYNGSIFYFHTGTTNTPTTHTTAWFYHNSMAGGHGSWGLTEWIDDIGGMPNFHFINNAVSGIDFTYSWTTNELNASTIETFGFNWCGGTFNSLTPNWINGTSDNIDAGETLIWDGILQPDYILPDAHAAIDAGIDVSANFTIDSIEYTGPLPGYTGGYFEGSAPDMGAVEHMDGAPPSNLSGMTGTINGAFK